MSGIEKKNLAYISLDAIIIPKQRLREVNTQSEKFQNLLRSIKRDGVETPVNVADAGDGKYVLIEGGHRYVAAKMCEFSEIPAAIDLNYPVKFDDEGNLVEGEISTVLADQVLANIVRVPQSMSQVTQALRAIVTEHPELSVAQLADRVCQSPAWVQQRLSLTTLIPAAMEELDKKNMPLANAVILAALPEEEQENEVGNACTEPSSSFVMRIKSRVSAIQAKKNTGRDAAKEWRPVRSVRPAKELMLEYQHLSGEVQGDSIILAMLEAEGVKITDKIKEAATKTFAWVIKADAASVAEQTQQKEARDAEKAAKAAEKEAAKEGAKVNKAALPDMFALNGSEAKAETAKA